MNAQQFKKIRKSTGMSQDKFAAALGYEGKRQIIRKEKAEVEISKQDELILAAYFPTAYAEATTTSPVNEQ